jgi:hypothetical protein
MKTAVEWLMTKLQSLGVTKEEHYELLCQLELHAKEMEKEQKKQLVIDTYIDLKMKDCHLPYGMQYHNKLLEVGEEAEQYYNETFKNRKSWKK